jgi:hypothetical protein
MSCGFNFSSFTVNLLVYREKSQTEQPLETGLSGHQGKARLLYNRSCVSPESQTLKCVDAGGSFVYLVVLLYFLGRQPQIPGSTGPWNRGRGHFSVTKE